ncbi:hypothetical protein BDV40DRAFT_148827 [Aspergillus tamarii]|uniref:Uncharacterized protein n=1 Tax=Aspergillus tamarii TaxID=41984 RepID=A0A5N6UWE2_ASPTM|nr:hypothetical protein BDV40DRAFT_148827 [Aspergillus tamarii]
MSYNSRRGFLCLSLFFFESYSVLFGASLFDVLSFPIKNTERTGVYSCFWSHSKPGTVCFGYWASFLFLQPTFHLIPSYLSNN